MNENNQVKRKSYLSKQMIAIIVIVSVAATLLVLFFAVIRPMIARSQNTEEQTESKPIIAGEALSSSSLKMMVLETDPALQVITLGKGEDYSWNLCVKEKSGEVYIERYEQLPLNSTLAPYAYFTLCSPDAQRVLPTEEELIALRAAKTAKMSKEEIEAYGGADKVPLDESDLADCTLDFAAYGFGDLSKLNYYRATDKNGVSHKIYIGDQTPDGEKRYAMYEGRKALYIVNAESMMMRAEELVSPILMAFPSSAISDYVPDTFYIDREGEAYVRIVRFQATDALDMDHNTNSIFYKLIRTGEGENDAIVNEYDTSAGYSQLLYDVFRSSIMGQEVVAISPCRQEEKDGETKWVFDDLPEETLTKYGIRKKNSYRSFSYEKGELAFFLVFSEPFVEDGKSYFYVYSPALQFIVKTPADKVAFVEKEDTFFISQFASMLPIDRLDRLTIDSTGLKEGYRSETVGLIPLKESYSLKYKLTADGSQRLLDADGATILQDVLTEDGKSLPSPEGSSGVANFRALYYTLIRINMNPNVESQMEEIEKVDLDTPDVVVTYEVFKGKTHILRFYFYGTSGNRCFYTYDDGRQRYVVSASDVAKVLKAVQTARDGQKVEAEV